MVVPLGVPTEMGSLQRMLVSLALRWVLETPTCLVTLKSRETDAMRRSTDGEMEH